MVETCARRAEWGGGEMRGGGSGCEPETRRRRRSGKVRGERRVATGRGRRGEGERGVLFWEGKEGAKEEGVGKWGRWRGWEEAGQRKKK